MNLFFIIPSNKSGGMTLIVDAMWLKRARSHKDRTPGLVGYSSARMEQVVSPEGGMSAAYDFASIEGRDARARDLDLVKHGYREIGLKAQEK